MATAGPPGSSSILPLLASLEDATAGQSEQTDAYLTILFISDALQQYISLFQAHITSPNSELSQAALQALGFCVYHSPDTLSALCSLVQKSTDKNTCTRALWVISKQSFPSDVVAKKVSISVWSREDIQSVVMEHEALNVVIRLLDQAPVQMGDGAVRWAKLVIPLVVHSASKVRLRAAAAMEMGLPLLLERQMEVAAIMEPMMSSKLIPELQKLFMSKNETNVLKLWPLFVKLLGKLLHRGGPFINSLLHLEELGFRSSSPTVKKIAFIAWKSLIDNFSLNPEILCSAKRMKLLMQPLTSINIRTEALLLTKVEVWWYLVVQLGPNLSSNFDQVSVPLLQCTIGSDFLVPGTSSRAVAQNGSATPSTPKTGGSSFNSSANVSRMSLNSSIQVQPTFPSIQLLGLEMLLHYFLGPEAVAMAAKRKLVLSLGESWICCLVINGSSFLCVVEEHVGGKERQGCEVLTLMLQALQSVVTSEALPADQVLVLLEATLTGVPQRVLGSTSYQVGKMDVLNGTPALFLVLLLYNSSMIAAFVQDERFFQCLQMLVGCGLSGPTSPLAFGEAVLGAIRGSGCSVQNKEQLLRMWSVMVGPLTETITQSNEVNQGDALEHNFSAVHSALLFPITHLLPGTAQKSMLSTWAKLYKVFACCSALVVTAEENICCEELCAKIAASVDKDALKVPATLSCVSSFLQVMVECVDFSPYTPQFQQKLKSPFTPVNWRKKNKVLGNLSTFQSLLVQCLEVYLEDPEACSEATGLALVSVLVALFTNLVLANAIQEVLTSLIQPLRLFYQQAGSEQTAFSLEKLLTDVLGCLQSRSTLAYDDELLSLLSPLLCVLFPHKNKHIRTSVTQFWNTTFANAVCLTYPENIRPILSQVKQKIPIILPGFEVVPVSDELSGQYSSESSQLETKLSGMPVSSVGKRDSLLAKASETKDRSSAKTSKPTKLDFSSPKPPRREVLEEEASIDFVFIPPETKERVLTEHQKEVKRTKRVDIPAMYNNLDSSLDTTAFTQYTQRTNCPKTKLRKSQETLLDENKTVDGAKDAIPELADVSMDDDAKKEPRAEAEDMESKDGSSPNISGSSDLVSGTPQKPNSRRQSFITLEKYAEGKSASPSSTSKFTGPLMKLSNTKKTSQTTAGPNPEESQSSMTGKINSQHTVSNDAESPRSPSSQEEDLDDSQSSLTQTSPTEPRRSGRCRIRPLLPGEGTEEREEKSVPQKRKRSGEELKNNSQKFSPNQSRPNTRSKQASEEDGGRLQRGTQKDKSETSLTNSQGRAKKRTKLFRSAEDFLDKPEPRRRSTREQDCSQTDLQSDTQSDHDSQSQGRRGRRSKASLESGEDKGQKKEILSPRKQSSQTTTDEIVEQTEKDPQTIAPSSPNDGRSQESELVEKNGQFDDEPKKDSQMVLSQTDSPSQESELEQENENEKGGSTNKSKDGTNKLTESEVKDKRRSRKGANQNLSQEDSQVITPSSSDSQSRRRSGRNKASSEAAESDSKDSSRRQSRSNSQTVTLPENQAEAKIGGRTRRSKAQEELSKSSPESSQSLDGDGLKKSQGRGRYVRRRSSQAFGENSESESQEAIENPPMPKKRGRKPRASLQSPLTVESKTDGTNNKAANDAVSNSQEEDSQSTDAKIDAEESQGSKDQESLQVPADIEQKESPMDVEDGAVEGPEPAAPETEHIQRREEEPGDPETNVDSISQKACDVGDSEPLQSAGRTRVEVEEEAAVDTVVPPDETAEKPQTSETLEDKDEDVPIEENQKDFSEPEQEELPVVPVEEDAAQVGESVANDSEGLSKEDEEPVSDFHTEDGIAPLQENDKDDKIQTAEGQDEDETQMDDAGNDVVVNLDAALTDLCDAPVAVDSTHKDVFQDSPVKQKDLESVMASEVGQSPSSGRTRGTWSPSASPSTSILKKGQKRPLEEETPSPLVKSRRVSFADPIQQQETADDIDRRSPAIRTSSPRRSKVSSIPQPKVPPRTSHSHRPKIFLLPGYKSSKKCLISEMSQEPRPVPRDCIYPALVGCSTPVEAVLPQISSNMWSRGFGQLVRARNIKTVGDLSALTPTEIKTLPIRSPKVSNVKKALKIYEQQLLDEPLPADVRPQQDGGENQTPDAPTGGDQQHQTEVLLLSDVEALSSRMTPPELSRCSPQELLQMHDQLGGLMRRVVVELHTRLRHTDGKP
uniref:Replication timing regulatory factor 1 n=1 Tax=Echeneis naucrates TaxID=173247 RepID=A0A665WXC8_ECHNA